MPPLRDQGDVMHLLGAHGLSPALDASGAPALSARPGDGLARCGWAAFFAALEAHGAAVEGSDGGPPRVVRR